MPVCTEFDSNCTGERLDTAMKSFEEYVREIHPELEENWKTNLALLGGGALGLLGAGKFAHDHMKKAQAEPTAQVAKADPGMGGTGGSPAASPSRPITRPAEGTPADAPPARPPGVSGAETSEPKPAEPERMVPKEPEKEVEVVFGDGKLPYETVLYSATKKSASSGPPSTWAVKTSTLSVTRC